MNNMTLTSSFNTLIKELKENLEWSCKNAGIAVDDAAGEAFSYVASYILNGSKSFSKDDIYRMMVFKAKRLIKDRIRSNASSHGRRSVKPSVSLDMAEESGQEMVEKASFIHWRNNTDVQSRVVWKVLDEICEERRISPINRKAFEAVELYGMPVGAVAQQLNLTPNNVYQICHRIHARLAAEGQAKFSKLAA